MQKLPIYHLSFPTQYLLTSTFLRFQEHYESPEFRGKTFSWETYMDWYASTYGNFTYTSDWNGFNIPSWVLTPFYGGAFDPLTSKEQKLLDHFKGVEGRFYVIGTWGGKELYALAHECIHALFYVVPEYGAAVKECLKGLPTAHLHTCLRDKGYAEAVHYDEINAYLLTGLGDGMDHPELPRVRRALTTLYRKYFGESLRRKAARTRLMARVHQCTLDLTTI